MALQVENAKVYKCSDGTVLLSRSEAQNHELKLDIAKFVAETGLGAGGNWTPSMIEAVLVEHARKLHNIFTGIFTARAVGDT